MQTGRQSKQYPVGLFFVHIILCTSSFENVRIEKADQIRLSKYHNLYIVRQDFRSPLHISRLNLM